MWPNEPDDFESLLSPPEGTSEDAWYFLFLDGQLVSVPNQGIPQPIDGDAFRWLDVEVNCKHYLGEYRGNSCFAVDAAGAIPEGYAASTLYGLLGRLDSPVFYLAGRAQQIIDWHNTHRFCGKCGAPTRDHTSDRAKECTSCGHIAYPRLSPSIIVLVRRGEEMLLARNANFPVEMYSTLAGFIEAGETAEECLVREVKEEVGVDVGDIRYFRSQSWPFPNQLMLGYFARYAGGDIVCDPTEIADADWFHYTELPPVPPTSSISGQLIQAFVNAQRAA